MELEVKQFISKMNKEELKGEAYFRFVEYDCEWHIEGNKQGLTLFALRLLEQTLNNNKIEYFKSDEKWIERDVPFSYIEIVDKKSSCETRKKFNIKQLLYKIFWTICLSFLLIAMFIGIGKITSWLF